MEYPSMAAMVYGSLSRHVGIFIYQFPIRHGHLWTRHW